MNKLIEQSFITEEIVESAILIPDKMDTINAVVFFDRAATIQVKDNKYLAYLVFIGNKKFFLIESGMDACPILPRIAELADKGIKKFLFINKAYSIKEKPAKGDILLVKSSTLFSTGKDTVAEADYYQKLEKLSFLISARNLCLDSETLYFKKNINFKKKEYSKYSSISTGDYYFLKYIKHFKLSGASINYIVGNLYNKIETDYKAYFDKVMMPICEFLAKQ